MQSIRIHSMCFRSPVVTGEEKSPSPSSSLLSAHLSFLLSVVHCHKALHHPPMSLDHSRETVTSLTSIYITFVQLKTEALTEVTFPINASNGRIINIISRSRNFTRKHLYLLVLFLFNKHLLYMQHMKNYHANSPSYFPWKAFT
jgi:hypothetical protein